MNIDEIKSKWQSHDARLVQLEEQNRLLERKIRNNSLNAGRSRLKRTYLTLAIVGAVMIPVALVAFHELGINTWVTVLYAVALLAMTIANLYVLQLINKLDFTQMTLCESMERVVYLEQTRCRLRIYMIVLALFVVAALLYDLYQYNISSFWGGVAGGVIGGLAGLKKERETRNVIRSMKADLADAVRED